MNEQQQYRKACPVCRSLMFEPAFVCPDCKADFSQFPPEIDPQPEIEEQVSTEAQTLNPRWILTLLLALFGGVLGIHRFYSGKIGTGFLYLCTFGLAGFGVLIDLAKIVSGNFRLKDGQLLQKY